MSERRSHIHGEFFSGLGTRQKETGAHAEVERPLIQDVAMLNVLDRGQLAKPKTLSSTVEVVTPTMARELRDTAHFERQRNISPINVDRLAKEMAAGQFTAGTQIYICVLPDGHELIVNGNHTLEAIHKCGVPQVLTVTRKAVMDIEEAGRIYAVFDIQKVRSWRDSLKATGRGDDIPLASSVLSAIGIIENDFAQGAYQAGASRLDRINRMEDYREAAEMMAAVMQGGPMSAVKCVRRAPVMAIGLETFRYQPSLAAEFWSKVAQDDGLTSGMPERALLQWLRNTKVSGGITAQREHCKAAAAAWNAAFQGEDRNYIKPNSMTVFFLLGTPWAKGLNGKG